MYLPSQSIERDEVKLHDENNERPSVPISSRRLPSLSMVCILRLQSMVRILLLSVLVVKHTGTEALNPPFSFLNREYLLKQWGYFSSEFTYELRVFTEVSVRYVQHFYFIRITSEVFTYVLAVDWFHDDDEFSPIDKRLTQRGSSRFWHDASRLCFPVAFPPMEEFLCGWATLEVSSTNKENPAQNGHQFIPNIDLCS